MQLSQKIERIEWGWLEGLRPRSAGCNARLGVHGQKVRVPMARLTTSDGTTGYGAGWTSRERAQELLGRPVSDVFSLEHGVLESVRSLEFALWDLVGKISAQPVWKLACAVTGVTAPDSLAAPCYDTSLYFDDLHLESDEEAVALMVSEAREGLAAGHTNFKIKVGRGARHMELEAGTRRDIAIIRAVHETIGVDGAVMIDANNGYNLSLTKRVLQETADCELFWVEEAFHEDAEYLRDLKNWLQEKDLQTLISDGEGDASPHLLNWARQGWVDVIQYDIWGHGFSNWLHLGKQLDKQGLRSAPHHYGGHFGNYAAPHLSAAIQNFTFAEWDEVTTPGIDGSAYVVNNGRVQVPDAPGFGVVLDEERFVQAVADNGFDIKAG